MIQYEIEGQGSSRVKFTGKCIASVQALNHDDSVRCVMTLYSTKTDYVCQRIDRPATIDQRCRVERCIDSLTVYQFFGTEPLANYLYGVTGLDVPGLRRSTNTHL